MVTTHLNRLWQIVEEGLGGIIFSKIIPISVLVLSIGCTKMSDDMKALNRFRNEFDAEIKKDYVFQTYTTGASMPD